MLPARLLFLGLILISLAVFPVSADRIPTVMVTNYSVSPPVLDPGGLGQIAVSLGCQGPVSVTHNIPADSDEEEADYEWTYTWTEPAVIDSVSLEGNGLTILSPKFDRIGEIANTGSEGQASLNLVFTVRAPEKSGIYYPEVRISTKGRSTRYPIPVNVNTAIGIQRQAVIIIESSYPETVNPGDEIPLDITVRNEGRTLADEMILQLGTLNPGIAPKTTGTYYLGILGPGEQKSVHIVLVTDRGTNPGLMQIPVILQYAWIDGSLQTDTSSIDIMMKGAAEIGIVSVDTSPQRVAAGEPFDLTIRIENTGTGQARQVVASVDLPMAGSRQSYIGKIEPRNDAPALFLMDGGPEGSYPYNVTITYVDDTGTSTEVRSMTLRVTGGDSGAVMVLLILIAIVAGVLVYQYWYRPRKQVAGGMPWQKKE